MGNTSQFVILGMLNNKPMTGYDIKKNLTKTNMDSFWGISYGQIYPSLRDLEKEGSITKEIEINENGPNRKKYSITSEGAAKLKQWLLQPAEPEKIRIETLLKVAFGENITKNELIKHLTKFKERCSCRLQNAIAFEKEIKSNMDKNEKSFFLFLTLLLGKNFEKAGIEWTDTAIQLIEEHEEKI